MARTMSSALVPYKQNIAILSWMLSAPLLGLLLFSWDGLESVGLAYVLIGVVGEIWYEKKAPPSSGYALARQKKQELWFGVMLMLGLAFELAAFPHHISESAKLKNQTEQLRNENLRMRKELAPRRLTGRQKEMLTSSLDVSKLSLDKLDPTKWATPWKPSIIVASAAWDPESSDFAGDFVSALQKAGWNAWPDRLVLNARFGVHLKIMPSTPPNLPGLKELRQALHAIGLPYDESLITEAEGPYIGQKMIQTSIIYLYIERKPLPNE
jgi:hypothetical protein